MRDKRGELTWQSRWNKEEGACNHVGPDAYAYCFLGFVKFRLDRPEDVAAIVAQARRFADMVEQTAQDYASADVGG